MVLLLAAGPPQVFPAESPASGGSPRWVFCCRADNDLYRVAKNYWPQSLRAESVNEAFRQSPPEAGVLVLADGYPDSTTTITPENLAVLHDKRLRLYVEYPSAIPGLSLGAPRATEWERGVVSSDAFGKSLPRLRILAIHGCRFVSAEAASPHLVLARVAGFDTAVYGLPSVSYPILFEHPNERILVATTKLSQFITGRYAPKPAWREVWRMVLGWLQPGTRISELDWVSVVHPTYGRGAELPPDALRQAILRGVDWHTKARMLIHPAWQKEIGKYAKMASPVGPRPNSDWPCGDGEEGMLEGFSSTILPDGSQNVRWWPRTDCIGESSLPFALRSKVDNDERSRKIAGNLLDWVYFKSRLFHTDPANPNFALLENALNQDGTFYQDNDVKAVLGCIGTSALLNTTRWDEVLLKNILGNFRTTGRYGYRGLSLHNNQLQRLGWQHYWRKPTLFYSGHYEAWSWATYLWLYDKTHFAPLLDRTKEAIWRMMAAYPDHWRWTNGLQQERGRMLLALAWLVRVEDTAEHRLWLKRIAADILADQVESGAIREALGDLNMGEMPPPQSNEAYGTSEAPLIHQNGDPIADLLYTCNFALLGLHEAAAATHDPAYRHAEERLIDFLLRAQVQSAAHPELDGAWFRAFDFDQWDYWGSNSDSAWGAWAIECGWTQGWITSGLALNYLNLSLWDISQNSQIARHMATVRPLMLPDDVVQTPPIQNRVRHEAIGKRVVSFTQPDPQYPGLGANPLTDGVTSPAEATADWLGYEGNDFEAVIDLGEATAIREVAVHCLQQTSFGIYLPPRIGLAVSDDGQVFRPLTTSALAGGADEPGPLVRSLGVGNLQAKARYLKIRVANLKQIPPGKQGAGRKAWLFLDEILINPVH